MQKEIFIFHPNHLLQFTSSEGMALSSELIKVIKNNMALAT